MVFDNKQQASNMDTLQALLLFGQAVRAWVIECEQAKGSPTCKAAIGAPTFCPHAQRHDTISIILYHRSDIHSCTQIDR